MTHAAQITRHFNSRQNLNKLKFSPAPVAATEYAFDEAVLWNVEPERAMPPADDPIANENTVSDVCWDILSQENAASIHDIDRFNHHRFFGAPIYAATNHYLPVEASIPWIDLVKEYAAIGRMKPVIPSSAIPAIFVADPIATNQYFPPNTQWSWEKTVNGANFFRSTDHFNLLGAKTCAPEVNLDSSDDRLGPGDGILGQILALADDWDGPGSLSPNQRVREVTIGVVARLSGLIRSAETEVDPSSGEVSFSWVPATAEAVVSVTIVPSGRVIFVVAGPNHPALPTILEEPDFERLSRLVSDGLKA